MVRWPGLVPPRTEINDIFSDEDWAATWVAAAGEPDIKEKLLRGYDAAGKNFRVHLDGYDQRDLLAGKAPNKRREFFYWTDDGNLAGLRYDQWKAVFLQQKAHGLAVWSQPLTELRLPMLFNLRSDPFERAQYESGDYVRWFIDHAFLLVPAQAIVDFVRATTDLSSPSHVPAEDRVAAFDQDGTLRVEQPMYTQVVYCLDRVPAVMARRPEPKTVEPFKTVLSGNREAIARLPMRDLEKILFATLSGMSVEEFRDEASKWIATARHPRWSHPYTDLVYQPMLEVLRYLRDNGYRTCIVTGGGQDFVRVYAERVYGIAPEQVVGTAGATKYGYGKDGKPIANTWQGLFPVLNTGMTVMPAPRRSAASRRMAAGFTT
jgi:phosphoglycolate phosphatase-like HAD superfamily hydrolase